MPHPPGSAHQPTDRTRRNLLLAVALLFVAAPALAENIGLQFDYPAGVNVSGFRYFCGDAPGQYAATPAGQHGATGRTITLTFAGSMTAVVSKYCIAKAYIAGATPAADVFSAPSNELKIDLKVEPIPAPQNLRTFQIQATIDLDTGEVVGIAIARAQQ